MLGGGGGWVGGVGVWGWGRGAAELLSLSGGDQPKNGTDKLGRRVCGRLRGAGGGECALVAVRAGRTLQPAWRTCELRAAAPDRLHSSSQVRAVSNLKMVRSRARPAPRPCQTMRPHTDMHGDPQGGFCTPAVLHLPGVAFEDGRRGPPVCDAGKGLVHVQRVWRRVPAPADTPGGRSALSTGTVSEGEAKRQEARPGRARGERGLSHGRCRPGRGSSLCAQAAVGLHASCPQGKVHALQAAGKQEEEEQQGQGHASPAMPCALVCSNQPAGWSRATLPLQKRV